MEVKLRQRERKVNGKVNRTTLYLSWWIKDLRKWHIEPLKLYLYPGKDRKAQNEETLALAKQIRNQRQVQLDAGSYGMIPESKRRSDFILFFQKLASERDKNWQNAARKLQEFSKSPIPFRSLTFDMGKLWLGNFKKYLQNKYSNNMAWLIESKVRAGIREAISQGLISRDFLIAVKPIRYQRPPHDFFTEDEINKLISTPFPKHEDVRRAALFSIFTGLRWSDYSKLTWRDIQEGHVCFKQKKTGEATQLPLTANALQILNETKVIDLDKKIFSLPSYKRTLVLLERWRRMAGITKRFGTHCGRHTYGHLMARAGLDPERIRLALGQETLTAALTYVHLEKGELKKDLDDKLPVFNIKGRA